MRITDLIEDEKKETKYSTNYEIKPNEKTISNTKRWFYAIITTIISMIICSFLIAFIFEQENSFAFFIGAGISYYAGRYVYNNFKKKENNPDNLVGESDKNDTIQ